MLYRQDNSCRLTEALRTFPNAYFTELTTIRTGSDGVIKEGLRFVIEAVVAAETVATQRKTMYLLESRVKAIIV